VVTYGDFQPCNTADDFCHSFTYTVLGVACSECKAAPVTNAFRKVKTCDKNSHLRSEKFTHINLLMRLEVFHSSGNLDCGLPVCDTIQSYR
jgi:hypothetical protein